MANVTFCKPFTRDEHFQRDDSDKGRVIRSSSPLCSRHMEDTKTNVENHVMNCMRRITLTRMSLFTYPRRPDIRSKLERVPTHFFLYHPTNLPVVPPCPYASGP